MLNFSSLEVHRLHLESTFLNVLSLNKSHLKNSRADKKIKTHTNKQKAICRMDEKAEIIYIYPFKRQTEWLKQLKERTCSI